MTLKTGISGLRGTVTAADSSLTPTTVVQWVQAFVAWLQATRRPRPEIALGRDARRSSPALAALARGALLAAGADVRDFDLTLTPSLQFAVRRDEGLDGGLMVTASHNPVVWNGLKFLDQQGFFLPPDAWQFMRERVASGDLPAVPLDQVGRVVGQHEGGDWQGHLQAVLDALPVPTIRRRHFRVALDACNSGATRWAELLEILECEPVLLHSEPHGFFAREPEPLPAHLGALRHLVRSARCDLGLAADPDGDRLVLVDARGEAVSEEHTVVLAALARAERPGDVVVVNVVTTHALEDALPEANIVRTAVGEMNVVNGVIEHHAVLGGEGSGGIIVPNVNLARDGLAAAGLVLALMAETTAPLHELVARIPRWDSVKAKLAATEGSPDALRALFARWREEPPEARPADHALHVGSADGSLALSLDDGLVLRAELPGGEAVRATGDGAGLAPLFAALHARRDEATLDLTDGVKLHAPGVWLSLRPSNTEPVVRVIGELRAP